MKQVFGSGLSDDKAMCLIKIYNMKSNLSKYQISMLLFNRAGENTYEQISQYEKIGALKPNGRGLKPNKKIIIKLLRESGHLKNMFNIISDDALLPIVERRL